MQTAVSLCETLECQFETAVLRLALTAVYAKLDRPQAVRDLMLENLEAL
jgi:hypothetical protein